MIDMLESYDREIQSLEGSINEAEEDLDNTRWGRQGGRQNRATGGHAILHSNKTLELRVLSVLLADWLMQHIV